MVCTVHEAEVGAAVEHIEVQGRTGFEHIAEQACEFFRFADMMVFVPVVEPAAPVFAAHGGLIGAELAEFGEVFLRMGTEVCNAEVFGKRTAGEHPVTRTVGGEQRAVNAAFTIDIDNGVEVFLVVAEGTVFVFDLYHDDVAAVGSETAGAEVFEQCMIVTSYLFEVAFVVAADGDVFVAEEPCRQTAEFPFTADVRTRTENDVQTELCGFVHISGEVKHTGEVKLTFLLFVQVPAGIGFNRVEAAFLQLGQAVVPVFARNTEVVHRTRNYGILLAVHEERFVVIR